jgi:isocitrate lyase
MTFQPRGISDQTSLGAGSYLSQIEAAEALLKDKPSWNGVTAEAVARMRLQNRFKTGLDIARYTAALMRADMAAYDADPTKYTQSLGCWHGFVAQQKLISHFVPNSDPCPINPCTKKPRCRR